MDIDQRGDVIEPSDGGGQILLPSEAHPGIIHVLPYERPFFPGQAIPLVVNAPSPRASRVISSCKNTFSQACRQSIR